MVHLVNCNGKLYNNNNPPQDFMTIYSSYTVYMYSLIKKKFPINNTRHFLTCAISGKH